ncbi:MAG TPA: oxygen-independent coproporphyrinogen III oxidase, partial [Hyphomicrobiaceae bacterium]|nr:oxygen-independent coproporphyrinogen III oxidase [Hyphomicrobiaceae bacterium]
IGDVQYVSWLAALPANARLSLYVHIPFCHSLCWYCGCNTKATHRYAPVAAYLRSLLDEIANVSQLMPNPHAVQHIHWGGGSPNILAAGDIAGLAEALRVKFSIDRAAEFAVEIDPRHMDGGKLETFARAGVTRVSIGVQDFDSSVQAAIGRTQSFETTRATIEELRHRGIASINIDLMYGLPHQTRKSVERTVEQVLLLAPNRIAVFGYAHLPERMIHQRLVPADRLPDALERFAQASRVACRLTQAGYVRVGLDHFAKPGDPLAEGAVHRNFQGYTNDQADALIGLGASAIGRLPEGYAQNAVAVGDYERRVRAYGLATARGIALTNEDKVRGHVIERLMCDLVFSADDLRRRFGRAAEGVIHEAEALVEADRNSLIEPTGEGFKVTERGRPFVRSIAARFDTYLGRGTARHAAGV